jgi:hypothetical protein
MTQDEIHDIFSKSAALPVRERLGIGRMEDVYLTQDHDVTALIEGFVVRGKEIEDHFLSFRFEDGRYRVE